MFNPSTSPKLPGAISRDMSRPVQSTNISLHHLRSAVAAADCGSFRQAAECLAVQHSVLSRSISQFEHLVGVALFDRSTGGVAPTPAGRTILQMSRMILEQLDTLVATGRSSGRGEAGHLSVGFCTSISAGNLRATLAEFRKRTPMVALTTAEQPRTRLMDSVRIGTIDVAVVPGGHTLSGQKRLPVWSERILIVLPKDHPLLIRDAIHWTDLHNETVLLSQRDPGSDLKELLVSKLVANERRPKIERHDVSRGIIKSLVSLELGISLVLEADVGANFTGVVYREIQDGSGPSRMGFNAYWRKDNENPALTRFLDLLAERYPAPPSTAEG
ncbi:LysR family transcriptional regulator [Bradyrhizobium ganzhouense]|uniref:LysR family transcriptional regulator n=1 Tax=Bradyrhizobium ganzhouense TaxID=1179767 RepID=UPI003CEEF87F